MFEDHNSHAASGPPPTISEILLSNLRLERQLQHERQQKLEMKE